MNPTLASQVETQNLTKTDLIQLEKDFLKWDNSEWKPWMTNK